MSQWYLMKDGQQLGPFDSNTMKGIVQSGKAGDEDLVWRDGMAEWLPASSVGELYEAQVPVPDEPEPATDQSSAIPAALQEPVPGPDSPGAGEVPRQFRDTTSAGDGGAMSWLVWIGLLILINVLSAIFDWPFWVY